MQQREGCHVPSCSEEGWGTLPREKTAVNSSVWGLTENLRENRTVKVTETHQDERFISCSVTLGLSGKVMRGGLCEKRPGAAPCCPQLGPASSATDSLQKTAKPVMKSVAPL